MWVNVDSPELSRVATGRMFIILVILAKDDNIGRKSALEHSNNENGDLLRNCRMNRHFLSAIALECAYT